MDSTTPTSTASSTVTESCISSQAPPPPSAIAQLLEISLISAQDLAPISKSMQTYAVTWINPNRKHTTRTDQDGHKNPMWNDKFAFRLDNESIGPLEDAAVNVEIYTVSWFRDVLVGTVRVQIVDLITPLIQTAQNRTKKTRFVTLQVRRTSGGPQGILNMGVALLDTTMRSMPLNNYAGKPPVKNFQQQIQNEHHQNDDNENLNAKIHLWRSLSTGSDLNNGSIVNGSTCENGSEICSDIGPSASIVAGELARKLLPPPPPPPGKAAQADDTGSSILEDMTIEEAKARGYRVASRERWRKAAMDDCDESSELSISSRHSRRRSDGSLFSCIAYGIEFTIVCGASKNPSSNRSGGSRRRKSSEVNSA